MKVVAFLFLSGLAAVSASCPNDCNGHGSCNVYSACDCYRNWMGADCSERVCYFGLAFVDTPAGDLNSDGLISGDTGIKSRMSNQDTYEIYPWYAGWGGTHYSVLTGAGAGGANGATTVHAVTSGGAGGEAHFYKECSNKGICNRGSGQCECFPGFTGEGCTRTACANDCSGHGTCTRMVDKASSYRGWDMYATQECACDPGYFGPDCSLRKCPMGDDPVTKYAGFTRITLQDKSTYGGTDGKGHYDSVKCADSDANGNGNSSAALANAVDAHGASPSTVDWVYRIWSHDKVQGSSGPYCKQGAATVCLGWNPWYAVGSASAPRANIANDGSQDDGCAWSGATGLNTAICEQNPVKYRSSALKGTAAITANPMVATGTASRASGKMTGGGCANATYDGANVLSCTDLDFWSLYLKDVTGTFQLGDSIRIDGYASVSSNVRTFGFELCNYIKEVGMYYASASNKVQQDEEQLLIIDYTDMTAKADCTGAANDRCDQFQGYFSLEFTDEMGDTWMTEAIKVSGSRGTAQATTDATLNTTFDPSRTAYDFLAAAATDGHTAGTGASGHALAVRIQDALEALPNNVVPNVQVEYRPHDGDVLKKRYYTISFLENTGNIPNLNVAYSFTDTVSNANVVSSNAECETTGGTGEASSNLKCMPYFGTATAAQRTNALANISASVGTATATIRDHTESMSTGLGAGSTKYGLDGTKENVECSNRGICDYSSGICQCFTGFTNRDCSVQNSLAMG